MKYNVQYVLALLNKNGLNYFEVLKKIILWTHFEKLGKWQHVLINNTLINFEL